MYAVLTLHAIGARGGGHPTCGKVRCGTLAYKIHLEQASISLGKDTHAGTRTNKLKSQEVSTTEPRAGVWAGTIDAYDRAQFAPMAARACTASHGAGGAGRRSTDRGELSLKRPPVCPTAAHARSCAARALSLSHTHARGTGGGSQPAGTARYFLPAVEKSLRFGSPQHFRLPHTREVAGTRPVRIPLGATSERGAKKDTVC